MTTERLDIDALLPDPAERLAAEKLSRVLAARLAQDESFKVILSNDESGVQYDLPMIAAKLLVKILVEIARGNVVEVVGLKPELTAEEAADLLGISHPRLIKLLESGKLPFYEVGTHHRIRLADVLAYRRKSLGERKAILREMVTLNQEMGPYD